MRPSTPPRLPSFGYLGLHRYFLTICTAQRQPFFVSDRVVRSVEVRLLGSAQRYGLSVYCYCFMPDHLHLLLVALRDDTDLREFARHFKQTSGYDFVRSVGSGRLWQAGYHDRVLRSSEASASVARYILENPVRAGLTRSFQDYPFSGSSEFTKVELAQLWDLRT